MQPQVQSLDQVIADLNPAYQQGTALLQQQQAGLGAKYNAQRTALGAEKVQGFNQINNQATARGMSFSGIPLDEQSTYLSTKYLPGLQQADANENEDSLRISQSLAAIEQEKRLKAMDIRGGQQSALESFLENERQRAFQAEQARLERAASAAQQAQANTPPTVDQYISDLLGSEGGFVGENRTNGWTEKQAAGQVANAYGLSRADALARIYKLRKVYETGK